MTINKAIEILDLFNRTGSHAVGEDLEDAMQLGIDALEREQRHRQMATSDHIWLLPGETHDNGGS